MVVLGFFPSLSPALKQTAESIDCVVINSISQKVIDFNSVEFEGDVEVIVDQHIHVWAERITFDKNQRILTAEAGAGKRIILETDKFFMLADKVSLNLKHHTGFAEKVRVHFSGAYLAAERAEKLKEDIWHFEQVVYTSCDAPSPHWSFSAKEALLHNDVIKSDGMSFKVKSVPLITFPRVSLPAPKFAVPSAAQAKTGLLLPGVSYSKRLGWGVDPTFYWLIAPHYDTTFGINWIEKKGFVLHNEFRRGRGPESFTKIKTQYAKERNAFKERKEEIVKTRDERYWIKGVHIQKLHSGDFTLSHLSRVDFGTDKRIEYEFFWETDAVEDRFFNSGIFRLEKEKNLIELNVEHEKSFREQFTIKKETKRELEDSFRVTRMPHLQWNNIFHKLSKIGHYNHHVFVDRVYFRRSLRENIYEGSKIIETRTDEVLPADDTVRIYYDGVLKHPFHFFHTQIIPQFQPNMQIRSKLRNADVRAKTNVVEGSLGSEGAYRGFFQGAVEWVFPEVISKVSNYFVHYMQLMLRWQYVPKFFQEHWYFADRWDRVFPRNDLEVRLRNHWFLKSLQVDFELCGSYEFEAIPDIFPLRRSRTGTHVLPLTVHLGLTHEDVNFTVEQEYEVETGTLLESEIDFSFLLRNIEFSLSWIYQNRGVQKARELLSDIPSFVLIGIAVPVASASKISYTGHLFSKQNSLVALLRDPKVLLHRVGYDYNGHCWGLSFGFEEKRYRQKGSLKREHQYFLSFRLENLVSLSKHFRHEPITPMMAPEGY